MVISISINVYMALAKIFFKYFKARLLKVFHPNAIDIDEKETSRRKLVES